MNAYHRPPWLATAVGIGIFLAVCIAGFMIMAWLAPQAPTPQGVVVVQLSAVYAPWLATAA